MTNHEKRKLFTPPGERPTCLTCGKTLRQETRYDREAVEWWRHHRHEAGAEARPLGIPIAGEFGYEGNGYFCTLRCGYQWAVRQVRATTRRGKETP